MVRIKLILDKPIIIERFSSELRKLVKEASASLEEFFEDSIDGVLGKDHKNIVIKLFNEWCYRNDITPLKDLYEILVDKFKHIIELQEENARRREIDILVKVVASSIRSSENNVRDIVTKCIDNIVTNKDKLEETTWICAKNLLKRYMSLFLDQTVHVIIARLLIYRVMEDKGYAPKRLINAESSQQFDPLKTLIDIRQDYESLLSNIYALSEFDWWYIPDIKRGLLSNKQKKILRRHEDSFRQVLKRVISILASYDLSGVNFDIWQKIYQHYLPEDERQRLGGFYTPYKLASLIIDLAGYRPDRPNLCKMKVLDPASGSGTFIVEAVRRLIEHLESKHECHTLPRTSWEKAKFILETIKENIYAIDIHPFATFLTSLNLTMLLLDYYFKVRHQDPEYRLELNVVTADSLMKKVNMSIKDFYTNARAKEAYERLRKYQRILTMKFDFVFGNPPWGSVLKGPLSPLWNPKKREEYKKRYESAYGKYDVCVLFLERGIEWLNENGILSMVVNNWFIFRDFGKGIRGVITDNTVILYLVDLGDFGKELFKAMNNPLIIVLQKMQKQNNKESIESPMAIIIRAFKKKGITAMQVIEEIHQLVEAIQKNNSEKIKEILQRVKDHISMIRVAQRFFKESVDEGWRLAEQKAIDMVNAIASLADKLLCYRVTDLFVDAQGVTTGLNEVFILSEDELDKLAKEEGIDLRREPLLYKCLSGREIHPWRIEWQRRWIIVPYIKEESGWRLAFRIKHDNVEIDSLDLSKIIDEREKNMSEKDRLSYRIAYGYIRYPNTAHYLFKFYEQLRNRVFEGKKIEEYAGAWYAYHRVRDLGVLTSKPKILTPRLCDKPSFAIDYEGYLPLDSVIALVPRDKFNELRKELLDIINVKDKATQTSLLYTLAFLNSKITHYILSLGAPRTPKGDYSIDERVLSKIVIPRPGILNKETIEKVIELAKLMIKHRDPSIQREIDEIVINIYAKLLGVITKDLRETLEQSIHRM